MENMQARNEKKSYCLSNERAAELMSKTERCSVIVTPQREIGRECKIDVMAATIETAREIIRVNPNTNHIFHNIRPEKQGDAINPQYAAEFGESVVIVTDKSKGISSKADERAENETQRLSREKVELSRRVEDKYNSNSENNKER